MPLFEIVRLVLGALRVSKWRAVLAMLGIITR